jgi:heme exporter protein B
MFFFKIFFQQEILQISKRKSYHFANIFSFIILLSLFQIFTNNIEQNLSANLFITFCNFALLSSILLINQFFLSQDFHDGTLEQIIIKCQNLEIMIVAKCLANWLFSCVPIIIFASIFSQILYGEILIFWQLFLILAIASLTMFFLFALCGCLNILGQISAIIYVIALPLSLPILIITNLAITENFLINLKILLALVFFIVPLASFSMAKIIKISCDS